jgi:hypothetical protein
MHTLSIVLRCCEFSTQLFHFQLLCSILKKTIDMVCLTPQDLNLYLIVKKKEMKSINVEYQVQVRYWATKNHL